MAQSVSIWPGSASFFSGDTPFGLYDSETEFQSDAEKVADWCAKRLGYPINDIEHARMALAMVSKYGTDGEKSKVRRAVEKKYPSLKKG